MLAAIWKLALISLSMSELAIMHKSKATARVGKTPMPQSGMSVYDQCNVVCLLLRAELTDPPSASVKQFFWGQIAVLPQGFHQTLFTEFLFLEVERLGYAVGVEEECISGIELPLFDHAIPMLEHTHHC
jgi:hypothetical protein